MKKILFIALAVISATTFSSCKKDYICKCTVSGVEYKIDIKDSKKADAEEACASSEAVYKIADATATCNLE